MDKDPLETITNRGQLERGKKSEHIYPTLKEKVGNPPTKGADIVDVVEGVPLERVEYYCGFGKCKPKWLQVFRNVYFISFLICTDNLIEGAVATGDNNKFNIVPISN